MRRHPVVQMLAIGFVASAVLTGLTLLIDWFPPQASTAAAPIDTLYYVLLIVSVPIFILVMTVAIYCVWRFRARPGDESDGEPIHGNARLEILWVAIPFVIVTVLAVYGWVVLRDVEAREPRPVPVRVIGQQFAWHFEYPQQGGKAVRSNQLYLPLGRQVEFALDTVDVIHSFWIPAFRIKQDTPPGVTVEARVTPNREGSFDVVCAELCGLGHATMRQTATVVPEDEFTAWLRKRGGTGVPAAASADPNNQ